MKPNIVVDGNGKIVIPMAFDPEYVIGCVAEKLSDRLATFRLSVQFPVGYSSSLYLPSEPCGVERIQLFAVGTIIEFLLAVPSNLPRRTYRVYATTPQFTPPDISQELAEMQKLPVLLKTVLSDETTFYVPKHFRFSETTSFEVMP